MRTIDSVMYVYYMLKAGTLFMEPFLSSLFYKRALLFLPLFTLFFSSTMILHSPYVNAQQSTDSFLLYNNPKYGIKIGYPGDWEKIEGGSGVLGQLHSKNITSIAAFNPPDKSAFVFVTIEKLPPHMTLSQDVNETITNLRKDISDFKILESEQTVLSGISAHKLVSEETIPMKVLSEKFGVSKEKIQEIESALEMLGGKLVAKIMYVFALKDNKEYGVSYGSVPNVIVGDQYSAYLPIAQKMIDSFQIRGSPALTNTSTVKPIINGQNQTCGQFLDTLKTRLVEGNITIPQYGDIRKAIGC